MTPCTCREKMDLEVYKTRIPRICQVRMDGFVGTSNPQVAGSIPAEGAKGYAPNSETRCT